MDLCLDGTELHSLSHMEAVQESVRVMRRIQCEVNRHSFINHLCHYRSHKKMAGVEGEPMRWTKTFKETITTWRARGLAISAGTRKAKMLCKRLMDANGNPRSQR